MLSDVIRRIRLKLYGAYDGSVDIIALHRYRLLYFAVPKVANTSIKVALAAAIDPERQRAIDATGTKSSFLREPTLRPGLYRDHILLNKYMVSRYNAYRLWAFVRNPWDRLVSCYSDKVMRDEIHRGVAESIGTVGAFRPEMPFDEFARVVCQLNESDANRHFRSQYTFLVDRKGELFPSRIGRFESLAEDFSVMCAEAGITEIELPKFKHTRHTHYHDYYDKNTRKLVADRYAKDIHLFGYEY